ncbi:hypothetical protein L5515_018792 [Caenorhabditis briggsae]|nr:hypothetical protein L5515_018792 [Caenorhabditis briggsae]
MALMSLPNQGHHDVLLDEKNRQELEEEPQEIRYGRGAAEDTATGYDQDFKRAKYDLRECQDELEKVRHSLEMLQARRQEREPQMKIGEEENVENGKKELEEELKLPKFLLNSTKTQADDLNSSLEHERRARNPEKAVHYQQKLKAQMGKKSETKNHQLPMQLPPASKSVQRKETNRRKPMEMTTKKITPARRQQPKVDYRGVQGSTVPPNKRK